MHLTMAPSHTPSEQLPFGYIETIANAFPYPSPPDPPPGPSLLDESQSILLGNFFNQEENSTSFDDAYVVAAKPLPGSYHYVAPGVSRVDDPFMFPYSAPIPLMQLPSTTPTSHADVSTPSQAGLQPTPAPTLLSTTASSEILDAASTLMQQNSLHAAPLHPHSADKAAAESMLAQHRMDVGYSQFPTTTASMDAGSGLAYADYSPCSRDPSLIQYSRANSPTIYRPTYASPFDVGASSGPHSVVSTPAAPKVEIRWGSDMSFHPHGYVPRLPPPQESIEKAKQDMLHKVGYIAARATPMATEPCPASAGSSPANTITTVTTERESRPSVGRGELSQGSPAAAKAQPRKRRRRMKEENAADGHGQQSQHHRGGSSESSQTMRNGAKRYVDGAAAVTAAAAAAEHSGRTRRGRGGGATGKAFPADMAKRWRQLSQTSAGSGRENLTDEQKRSNHILSEQKRRNLIKQGFDDLCSLVPDLRCGGYSKSAVLAQAADWLEDLQKGNEELREMLASLEATCSTA